MRRFGEGRLRLPRRIWPSATPNALRESVRAADLMPESVDAQMRAGLLLLLAGQYPEARARALAALAKEPKNARRSDPAGNALAGLKDLDAAIEQVEQAIEKIPSSP